MNGRVIAFWLVALVWFFVLLADYSRSHPASLKSKDIAVDALFLALIALMGFVPQVGYITIVPGLSLTLMHLPVLLGAYLYGWKKGTLYGFAFGVTSWLMALQNPVGFNGFFVYPWVSVLPRLLFGFASGLFFQLLKKTPKIYLSGWALGGASALLTCLHTGLVFLDLYAFFPTEIGGYFQSGNSLIAGVAFAFALVVGLGMIGEASLSAVLVPLVGQAVAKRLGNSEE